jgi:hypothetical protein
MSGRSEEGLPCAPGGVQPILQLCKADLPSTGLGKRALLDSRSSWKFGACICVSGGGLRCGGRVVIARLHANTSRGDNRMTGERLPLAKAGGGNILRMVAEVVIQMSIETSVETEIGAGRDDRTTDHTTYLNGCGDWPRETWLAVLRLRIPKLRSDRNFRYSLGLRHSEKAPTDPSCISGSGTAILVLVSIFTAEKEAGEAGVVW